MSSPADYHMHTALCRHATGMPRDYAAQAVKLGLTEIGFSDHSPMRQDDFDDWRMRLDQLDDYVAAVKAARGEFPQLIIRLALEVDYLPDHEDWIRDLSGRHPWDYLIGSVHYISNGWDIDSPFKISRWKEHEPYTVWSEYFERLARAACSGLFDIIGHADLPKKFGFVPREDCTPLYDRFLQAAAASGCAIELNTAGLRKDCREIYPSQPFLNRAHSMGVPITFGSDAHAAGEVGLNFAEAIESARQAGYIQSCRFQSRQRTQVPL